MLPSMGPTSPGTQRQDQYLPPLSPASLDPVGPKTCLVRLQAVVDAIREADDMVELSGALHFVWIQVGMPRAPLSRTCPYRGL